MLQEKDVEALSHYLKKIALRIALYPLRILPVKQNRVMLHDDMQQKYSCNPKYVCNYLLEHYPDKFEIVFSVRDPDVYKNFKNNKIHFVKFNSFDYFRYILSSKVFLTNSGGYSYVPLKKNQIVINTHHGGGAYKKIGRYVYGDTKIFRKDLKLQADETTVFLSSCKKFTEVVSRSLLMPKKIFWEIGMPRNDMLVKPNDEIRNRVRENLGIKSNQHLVLYAPTYRKEEDDQFKNYISIAYGIDADRTCDALSKRFGGEWIFAFRMHPCVVNKDVIKGKNVIDLTAYDDMQELLLAADVMINDFSSSMWDFLLTGKPSFMFAVDLEHYIETTDLETPIDKWPFPKATSNDELEAAILNFDEDKYKEDCTRHYQELGGCETGNASALVCEYIYNHTLKEKRKKA